MKLYKKIYKAFGGSALYIDKTMLNHLNLNIGDEVVIDFEQDKLIISKAKITNNKIEELLNAYKKS